MANERQIVVASLVMFALGISLIYASLKSAPPVRIDIARLSDEHLGKYVEISGSVRSVKQGERGASLLICKSSSCVRASVPEAAARAGDYVYARGVLGKYGSSYGITLPGAGYLEVRNA